MWRNVIILITLNLTDSFSLRPLFSIIYFSYHLQTFAIRFGTSEIAKEFKEAFIAGQGEMTSLLAGEDSKEGKEEADEAVKAMESLAVKEEKVEVKEEWWGKQELLI